MSQSELPKTPEQLELEKLADRAMQEYKRLGTKCILCKVRGPSNVRIWLPNAQDQIKLGGTAGRQLHIPYPICWVCENRTTYRWDTTERKLREVFCHA